MSGGRWISSRPFVRALLAVALVIALVSWSRPADAHLVRVDPIAPEIIPTPYAYWQPTTISEHDEVLLAPMLGGAYAVWSAETGTIFPGTIADALPIGAMTSASMNDDGQVAGALDLDPAVAFTFDPTTTTRTALPTGGFPSVRIDAIADDGTIVGTVNSVHGGTTATARAATWTGSPYQLHLLPDLGNGSFVSDVNDHGLAVGEVVSADTTAWLPVVWDLSDLTMTDLSPHVGVPVIDGRPSVDDEGRVLVPLGLEDPDHPGVTSPDGREVVFDPATNRVIEPFAVGMGSSVALSPRGELLFHELAAPFDFSSPVTIVVLDLETGARRELPPMPVSWAGTINDRGQVAFSSGIGTEMHAFVWDPIAGLIDLGDGDGHGLQAAALNERGRIGGVRQDDVKPWLGTLRLNPQPPQQLSANSSAGTSTLRWNTPTSAGDAPVDTYDVYRNGALVATVPASTQTFADDVSALASGSTATYEVTATNVYGESGVSESVTLVVSSVEAAPATPVAATPAFTG